MKYKKRGVNNQKWDRPSRSANKFKVLWPLLFHNISCRLCDSVTLTLSRCWRIWILFIIFNICIKSNPLASLGRHVECPDHSSWAQHNPPKRVKRDLLYTFQNYYSFFFFQFQQQQQQPQTALDTIARQLLYIHVKELAVCVYNTHTSIQPAESPRRNKRIKDSRGIKNKGDTKFVRLCFSFQMEAGPGPL